jgi:two-component system, OmpR family, catabolic regulation response regulator CreB
MSAPRILVVEDDRPIADAVVYALRTEGMETVWHATGRAAVAEVARGAVDLVVLDVGLPDANGFDVCRELRRISAVPVIFLTARADEVDRVVGLELGADDYLAKPFSPRELSARVRAVLRRTRGVSRLVTVGALTLDEDRLAVVYHGAAVTLTAAQFRILRALAARPGMICSRQDLGDAIGGDSDPGLERTIDSHIKDLRGRLRAIKADAQPIVTVRGEGYSLAERP